jgi:hypothetical protein
MKEGRPAGGVLSSGRDAAAIGMLLLILGLALFLNNMDFGRIFGALSWWPVILILVGLILIFKDHKLRHEK